jgi:hypothetical protein
MFDLRHRIQNGAEIIFDAGGSGVRTGAVHDQNTGIWREMRTEGDAFIHMRHAECPCPGILQRFCNPVRSQTISIRFDDSRAFRIARAFLQQAIIPDDRRKIDSQDSSGAG